MTEESIKEDQAIENIVVAIEAIDINKTNEETCKNEAVSITHSFSDAQSVVSDSVKSATQSKSSVKQKKKTQKKKFKKKRINSESSESSKTSTTSNLLPEKSTDNKVDNVVLKESVNKQNETKNGNFNIGRKHFKRLQLPYNGRIIDGVIYATDNHNVLSPIQTPRSFHKNISQFSVPNGIIPMTYETPFRVRNNHSYKHNYRNNYPLSVGYMPQQKVFRPTGNYQSNNFASDYYYGQNPFPKVNKKPEMLNCNKVTEKVENEQSRSSEIIDENVNVSSTSVNTLVALK